MELLEEHRCFEGRQQRWRHDSTTLNCAMTFSIFLPPADNPPVLYWLSGLTCNDENFTTKAGAQRIAAELGIALVMPDTSPRGDDVADDAGYDLGKGAGFYLNATEQPWASHYRMYDYIRDELPATGALSVRGQRALRDKRTFDGWPRGADNGAENPGKYTSVSAFAPIVNPTQVPWGQKPSRTIWVRMQRNGRNGTAVRCCWQASQKTLSRCWWIRVMPISSSPGSYSLRCWRKPRARRTGR